MKNNASHLGLPYKLRVSGGLAFQFDDAQASDVLFVDAATGEERRPFLTPDAGGEDVFLTYEMLGDVPTHVLRMASVGPVLVFEDANGKRHDITRLQFT